MRFYLVSLTRQTLRKKHTKTQQTNKETSKQTNQQPHQQLFHVFTFYCGRPCAVVEDS